MYFICTGLFFYANIQNTLVLRSRLVMKIFGTILQW